MRKWEHSHRWMEVRILLAILVILGSTRQNRAGEQIARWVVQRAKNQSQ